MKTRQTRFFRLIDRRPLEVADFESWWHTLDDPARFLARDAVGDKEVSTIFLGIEPHGLGIEPPLLFETAVFYPGDVVIYARRTASYAEALAQHEAARLALTLETAMMDGRIGRA